MGSIDCMKYRKYKCNTGYSCKEESYITLYRYVFYKDGRYMVGISRHSWRGFGFLANRKRRVHRVWKRNAFISRATGEVVGMGVEP